MPNRKDRRYQRHFSPLLPWSLALPFRQPNAVTNWHGKGNISICITSTSAGLHKNNASKRWQSNKVIAPTTERRFDGPVCNVSLLFTTGQYGYFSHPSRSTSGVERLAAGSHNQLIPGKTGPFMVINVLSATFGIDEKGIRSEIMVQSMEIYWRYWRTGKSTKNKYRLKSPVDEQDEEVDESWGETNAKNSLMYCRNMKLIALDVL